MADLLVNNLTEINPIVSITHIKILTLLSTIQFSYLWVTSLSFPPTLISRTALTYRYRVYFRNDVTINISVLSIPEHVRCIYFKIITDVLIKLHLASPQDISPTKPPHIFPSIFYLLKHLMHFDNYSHSPDCSNKTLFPCITLRLRGSKVTI